MNPVRPDGGMAVMAARASARVPDALDYFPTPPWAARAGGALIKALDPQARTCWEPACGEGHMAHGLADHFDDVLASDIHPYGYGQVIDFLAEDAALPWPADGAQPDWIVTNPPFVSGERFARTALRRAGRGVAMLLRLAFLEGVARHRLLFQDHPLSVLAQFAERVPMVKGRWDPEASSATAYAWFIWMKTPDAPHLALRSIPPGAKQKWSRAGDVARFCALADAPLLESPAVPR